MSDAEGSWLSRKLAFATLTAALVLVAGRYMPPAALGDVLWALTLVCAIYLGGNTATRLINARFQAPATPKGPAPAKPAKATKPAPLGPELPL